MSFQEYVYTETDFKVTRLNPDVLHDALKALTLSVTYEYLNYLDNEGTFVLKLYFSDTLLSGDIATITAYFQAYTYAAFADHACVIKDVRAVGTNGGSVTANVDTVRVLNTLVGDVDFAALGPSANQFTLQAGTFFIRAKAPATDVENHQAYLYNVTDSKKYWGTNAFSKDGLMTASEILESLTLTAAKTFELHHLCSKTKADTGFGRATGFNSDEVYSVVTIERKL